MHPGCPQYEYRSSFTLKKPSEVLTPEEYAKQKEAETVAETVEEIVHPVEQNLIGMDNAENLGEKVASYNYDRATGVYQTLDISPEKAEETISRRKSLTAAL